MNAVKAFALDPLPFAQHFAAVARLHGFREEIWGDCAGVPLASYTKRTPGASARIYVSSGVHGDEPAAPHALLRMLETGSFDARATWFLCPLINPTGFQRGTRENAEGIDLNRDYLDRRTTEIAAHVRWLERQPRFDAVFCLHEDWESTGCYVYELNPDAHTTPVHVMLAAASQHLPIETGALIDGRISCEPGIIRPLDDPLMRETWPEAIYLHAHHARRVYTFETPSAQPLETRVASHVAAIQAALAAIF
jgi:murein peptide amidase A